MRKILIVLLLVPVMVFCQKPEDLVHNSRIYVDDYANLYTDQQELELDGIIRKFFDTAQISVVTIKTFGDIDPADYCLRLGRKWGVGGQSSNGLLLVIGLDDRQMQVATGYGLEGDLADVTVVNYQEEYAVPRFKEGKYFEGTRDLLNAYINKLSPSAKALRAKEDEVQKQREAERVQDIKDGLITVALILAVAFLFSLPFILRWRKKQKIKRELERIEEEKREVEEQKRRAEQEKQSILASRGVAERYIKDVQSDKKYSHKYLKEKFPDKMELIGAYFVAIGVLVDYLKREGVTDFRPFLDACYSIYNDITYVYVPPPVVHKSYSSSDDDDNNSSSGSSFPSFGGGGSGGGSSFGGGSFGGGGGGSKW